jgi:hypothetical protein
MVSRPRWLLRKAYRYSSRKRMNRWGSSSGFLNHPVFPRRFFRSSRVSSMRDIAFAVSAVSPTGRGPISASRRASSCLSASVSSGC